MALRTPVQGWAGAALATGWLLAVAGCSAKPPPFQPAIADLPLGLSNNAVALVADDGAHFSLFSFLGLTAGKTWRDVTDRAFEYDSRSGAWSEMPSVPGGSGRLAATAQTVAGMVYLFGGYSVAEDGTEVSTPEVYRFDPAAGEYQVLPRMPVPVDDAVSAVYRNRYVYLVSGWHDIDNVDNVQVFDTDTDTWLQATAFPGAPLFGHVGGLIGNTLVICDGVKVLPPPDVDERRQFVISNACFLGLIDNVDLTRIDWRALPPHPGKPTYRAAGVGAMVNGAPRVVIAGGTHNPYNYDGVGYDRTAAPASRSVVSFDVNALQWLAHEPLSRPSMDHRSLIRIGTQFTIVGGMGADQRVLASSQQFELR